MADEFDPTRPGARFPYAVAVFCAACVAAVVWTSMLYSYAWPANLADLAAAQGSRTHPLVGRYVWLRRPEEGKWSRYWPAGDGLGDNLDYLVKKILAGEEPTWVPIKGLPEGAAPEVVYGRVVAEGRMGSTSMLFLGVDAAASRWTGASVAGLVVGAMGVFIFVLHLKRWLRVRGLARGSPVR